MDITKMTEVELKALAFDELQKIDSAQRNLQAISSQLALNAEKPKKDETKQPK